MFVTSLHRTRRSTVRAALVAAGIDALLVTDLINVRYLTGFTGSNAALLLVAADDEEPEQAHGHTDRTTDEPDPRTRFCTDGRYTLQSQEQVPDLPRLIARPCDVALLRAAPAGSVGFEARSLPVAAYDTLQAIALGAGTRVAYVKPHGALYNAVVHHEAHARAVVAAVEDLPVLGLPGSAVLAEATARGLRSVTEAFADRGYRSDGTLVPRSEPGALVTDADAVTPRVLRLVRLGRIRAVDGTDVPVPAESVCVHSDTAGAAALAAAVRNALRADGVTVAPFAD